MGVYQTELEAKIAEHPFAASKARKMVDECKQRRKLEQLDTANRMPLFKEACTAIEKQANAGETQTYIYPKPDSFYQDFNQKHPNALNVPSDGISFTLEQRNILDTFKTLGYMVAYEQGVPHKQFPQYLVTQCMIRW